MSENSFHRNVVELHGFAYGMAKEIFGVEPVEASDRKQRKIRKWICKNYPVYDDFKHIDKKQTAERF